MAVNRGKQFENVIKESFEKIKDVSIDRLHDQTTGYVGSSNICDFIVYKYPTLLYIECKSCHGNTWSLSNLTDNQYRGLLQKSRIMGVVAGVIVWWIDKDVTEFFTIEYLRYLKDNDYKSINYTNDNGIVIPGKKKKVFFDYDMGVLL